MADTFLEITKSKVATPADNVISKIKDLINSGILKPGDRLPAERKMAAEFGFGRTQIREALQKLEFYGIVKTLPQSGSIINGLDINTLDGLISDVLNLQDYDFFSLVETRLILELKAVRLCAERWEDRDMKAMENACSNFIKNADTQSKVSDDFAFHRAIAEGSHNPVLKAMLLVVITDIMTVYEKEQNFATKKIAGEQHEQILSALKNRDAYQAESLMAKHLNGVMVFASEKIGQKQIQY